jgi:Mg2+-importing ATPase
LAETAEHATVFTKMSPLQKSRVIRALKGRGHTVGYLGDGINDAAALKDADVGISVDTAVDIAKESADIILLEKSLMVLEEAVVEGRRTFANINKYIKMTASSNFGNVFSVLIASVFLPFLPMLPIQLLTQNLLYDISQISIPWDDVDHEYLTRPRKWDASGLARFMVFIGPISSIFDVVTFLVLWYALGANSIEKQALFQTGWFVVGLLTRSWRQEFISPSRSSASISAWCRCRRPISPGSPRSFWAIACSPKSSNGFTSAASDSGCDEASCSRGHCGLLWLGRACRGA